MNKKVKGKVKVQGKVKDKMKVHYSSNKQNWQTPKTVFDKLNKELTLHSTLVVVNGLQNVQNIILKKPTD